MKTLIVCAVVMSGAFAACSSGSDAVDDSVVDSVVDSVGVDDSVVPSSDVEAFCASYATLLDEQPEDYVGSDEHISDVEGLLDVAPDEIRADVEGFLEFLRSGAIDTAEDPDSNVVTNWPTDVQESVTATITYGSTECGLNVSTAPE